VSMPCGYEVPVRIYQPASRYLMGMTLRIKPKQLSGRQHFASTIAKISCLVLSH
jgi:hypothetical protein